MKESLINIDITLFKLSSGTNIKLIVFPWNSSSSVQMFVLMMILICELPYAGNRYISSLSLTSRK